MLQALEKQQESLLHFREAVKLAPWNFEAQKGTLTHIHSINNLTSFLRGHSLIHWIFLEKRDRLFSTFCITLSYCYRKLSHWFSRMYFVNWTGLVECYMSAKRHKEALTVAKNAHKTLGANPRTLTVRPFTTWLRILTPFCWFSLAWPIRKRIRLTGGEIKVTCAVCVVDWTRSLKTRMP